MDKASTARPVTEQQAAEKQSESQTDNEIIFESAAFWVFGAFVYSLPIGKLRLFASGRLEFVLDAGTTVFSAPTAHIKFLTDKPDAPLGTLKVVVGPRRYDLQFFDQSTQKTNSRSSIFINRGSRFEFDGPTAGDWEKRIADSQSVPADNLPIIALSQNAATQRHRRLALVSMISTVAIFVVIGIIVGLKPSRTMALLLTTLALFFIGELVWHSRQRVSRELAKDPVLPSPEDTLPAHTDPTGAFSMSKKSSMITIIVLSVVVMSLLAALIFVIPRVGK